MAGGDAALCAPEVARVNMVEGQLRAGGVRNEAVLLAMESIPREAFVPQYKDKAECAALACRDSDIPVGYGRWMLAPLLCARMLEALDIAASDHALVVGAATGYVGVLLASLAGSVVALEQDPELISQAEANFALFQTQNIELIHGIISNGWKMPRLYDTIFINGGIQYLPELFYDQMAEGARLVSVFVDQGGMALSKNAGVCLGAVRLYQKKRGYVSHRDLFEAQIRVLPAFATPLSFQL